MSYIRLSQPFLALAAQARQHTSYKSRFIFLLIILLFICVVSLTVLAATPYVSFEAEGGTKSGAITASDSTASAGSYLQFGDSPTPSPSGIQPTRENTGPRYAMTNITPEAFYSSRTCNRQKIVGSVNFDQAWMKGQTFSMTDCEITGRIFIYINGGGSTLSTNDMPIINLDHVDVTGGIIALNAAKLTADYSYITGSQIGLKDYWAPFISAPAPYVFTNSIFYGAYASQPTHTEALHVGDYGTGYRFTNVAFIQGGGPLANSGVTATINFHGNDTIFDGCWFIWEGETPAYFTAYIDGQNTVVKNSWFASAPAGYVYPDSSYRATYENNRDIQTGQVITNP